MQKTLYNISLSGEYSRATNIYGINEVLKHYEADLKDGIKATLNRIKEGETVLIGNHLSIN